MADEIYTSSTYFGNVSAATLMRLYALKIGHRDASVLNHPVIRSQWEDNSGIMGAVAEEIPILGLGLDKLTSRTEGQAAPNIQPSSTTITPTVARHSGQILMSGIARARALRGTLAIPTLIDALVGGGQLTLISLVTAIHAFYVGQSAGSTGVAAGVTQLKAICDRIRRNGEVGGGPLLAILKPYTWEGITDDGLGMGGAFQMSPEAQRMIGGVYGGSYQGRFLDGTVDVFTSDEVATMNAGADYANMILGQGSIAIRTEAPPEGISADVLAQAGYIRIEADRDAAGDDDMVIAHTYMGATGAQAAGGGILISKVA